MIKDIITYLNLKLESVGYFNTIHCLAEQVKKGDKIYPAIYNGANEYQDIALNDNLGSIAYWRKASNVSISEQENKTTSNGVEYLTSFTLKLVCFVQKENGSTNDQYFADNLATVIISNLTTNSSALKQALKAKKVSVIAEQYITDGRVVSAGEFENVAFEPNYTHSLFSIDFKISIITNNQCFSDLCNDTPIIFTPSVTNNGYCTKILIKTEAEWALDNTVYSERTLLVTSDAYYGTTDQRKFKLSDGTQTWSNLDYAPISQTLAQVLANGNKTGEQLIKSDDGTTQLQILNGSLSFDFISGLYSSSFYANQFGGGGYYSNNVKTAAFNMSATSFSISHDDLIELTAPTLKFNGNFRFSGNAKAQGTDNSFIYNIPLGSVAQWYSGTYHETENLEPTAYSKTLYALAKGYNNYAGYFENQLGSNNVQLGTPYYALVAQGKSYLSDYLTLNNLTAGRMLKLNASKEVVSSSLAESDIATTSYVDGLVAGLLDDRGSYDASVNLFPSTGGSGTAGAIMKGDIWYISVAGTLGGVAVTVGDSVRALVDSPAQTASNWSVLETNIGYVPENVANKTDTVSGNETSSTKFLSVKGYYDYLVGLTWLTDSRFGTWLNGLTAKTTPVDADGFAINDSADSNKAKFLSFTNLKAFLKTYFDTQYANSKQITLFYQRTEDVTYTGFTGNTFLEEVEIPAKYLGPNSEIEVSVTFERNSGGTSTNTCYVGLSNSSSTFNSRGYIQMTTTQLQGGMFKRFVFKNGNTIKYQQISIQTQDFWAQTSTARNTLTLDRTQPIYVSINGYLGTSTDSIIINEYRIMIYNRA